MKKVFFVLGVMIGMWGKGQQQWTWVSGDQSSNHFGIYGIKGVAAASNKPGARMGSISWSDNNGNLWLFGGSGYAASGFDDLNDLWKYNINIGQWTWIGGDNTVHNLSVYGIKGVANANNKPGSRYNSISWTDANGNLWLFGGVTDDASGGNLNDLWKYNISSGQWTWVSVDSTYNGKGIYGVKGVATASNKPGAREHGVSWTDANDNLWLFGGIGYATTLKFSNLNDLWKYNINSGQWMWVNGDDTTSYSNIGVFGIKGIAAVSNKPGATEGSISWTDTNGNLWLFGGYSLLNALWKYNIGSGQWTWVSGDSISSQVGIYGTIGVAAASNKPSAREGCVSWADAIGNLWLFGGYGQDGNNGGSQANDLWKYDIGSGQWTWISGDSTNNHFGIYGIQGLAAVSNKPGSRMHSISWSDNNGNLWLFGGGGYSSINHGDLNDLWVFNTQPLPPQNPLLHSKKRKQ